MRDLVTTNDPVLLSYLQVLLKDAGIEVARVRRQHERRAGHARRRRRSGSRCPRRAGRRRAACSTRPASANGSYSDERDRGKPESDALTDDAFLGGALQILQPRPAIAPGSTP